MLELHSACHELPLRAFQDHALTRLSSIVAFDSALIATGTVIDGIPDAHDFYLHRQTPELMMSWETVKHLDRVSMITTSNPGHTMIFAAATTYEGLPEILAHCARFGITHLLSTAVIDQRAGSFVVLSLYRADADHPYAEAERAAVEVLVPHLVESVRQSRLDDLRRATHVSMDHTPATAMVNRMAVVLEAEPRLIELFSQSFPDWTGPRLPTPLTSLADATTPIRRLFGRLMVSVDPADDLVLMRVRTALPIDTLTDREREVAQLVASGDSTKEIAARLGIAVNTVRVHVTRVYAKLGVVNKAELASMLAGLE